MYTHALTDKIPTLNELMIFKYYMDEGVVKKLRIIRTASPKWKVIASLICDEAHAISVLEQKCQNDPQECLRQIFIEYFIDRKPLDYSHDWKGLIELLDDAGLEGLAKEVEYALTSVRNEVNDNSLDYSVLSYSSCSIHLNGEK